MTKSRGRGRLCRHSDARNAGQTDTPINSVCDIRICYSESWLGLRIASMKAEGWECLEVGQHARPRSTSDPVRRNIRFRTAFCSGSDGFKCIHASPLGLLPQLPGFLASGLCPGTCITTKPFQVRDLPLIWCLFCVCRSAFAQFHKCHAHGQSGSMSCELASSNFVFCTEHSGQTSKKASWQQYSGPTHENTDTSKPKGPEQSSKEHK